MAECGDGSAGEVLMQFHNLGETCEFGFAQRAIGIEPLHLFRFIGLHEPSGNRLERMVAGLAVGFSGLGEPEDIRLIPLPEWNMVCFSETRYGLFGHTGIRINQEPAEKTRADLVIKLRLLLRKFHEDLATGEKIFIWQASVPLPERKVRYLFDTLREFGPNQMVWLPPRDERAPSAKVDMIADGLVRATKTRKPALGDLDPLTAAEWVSICRQSLKILRGSAASAPI